MNFTISKLGVLNHFPKQPFNINFSYFSVKSHQRSPLKLNSLIFYILKSPYTAKNEKSGYEQLQKVKEKWQSKNSTSLRNWEDNWDAICPFFSYSEPLRKIMYTTNTIESLNRSFRKYTKTKSVFPSDESLMKCLYHIQL